MLAMLCVYRLREEHYHLARKIYTKNISYEVCHGLINYILPLVASNMDFKNTPKHMRLKSKITAHNQVQNNNQIGPTKFAKISYYKNSVLKKILQSLFNKKLCCKQMD
jgi:hypothetical protein